MELAQSHARDCGNRPKAVACDADIGDANIDDGGHAAGTGCGRIIYKLYTNALHQAPRVSGDPELQELGTASLPPCRRV